MNSICQPACCRGKKIWTEEFVCMTARGLCCLVYWDILVTIYFRANLASGSKSLIQSPLEYYTRSLLKRYYMSWRTEHRPVKCQHGSYGDILCEVTEQTKHWVPSVNMEFLSVNLETKSCSSVTTAGARRRVTRRPRDRWTVVVGPEIRYVLSAILQLHTSNCMIIYFL